MIASAPGLRASWRKLLRRLARIASSVLRALLMGAASFGPPKPPPEPPPPQTIEQVDQASSRRERT